MQQNAARILSVFSQSPDAKLSSAYIATYISPDRTALAYLMSIRALSFDGSTYSFNG